jgi:hypothetical protein
MTERTFPACPPELCSKVQPAINQYCKNMGWQPGHPIIVMDEKGSYCYCECGGGSAESGGETAGKMADD